MAVVIFGGLVSSTLLDVLLTPLLFPAAMAGRRWHPSIPILPQGHHEVELALILTAAAAVCRPGLRPRRRHPRRDGGAHGDQLRMSGAWHLELVLAKDARGDAPAPVRVYLSDHGGKPMPVAGASGSAVLLAGRQTERGAGRGGRPPGGQTRYAADPAMRW